MNASLSDPFASTGKLQYKEYEIDLDTTIGKGAFGIVYACTRTVNNKKTDICVKIVKRVPHQESVLEKEILIVNKIGEKGIQVTYLVKTFEIYEEPSNNYVYFFMEKCDTTLDKYMNERFNKKQRFSSEEIQNLISQLATGYKSLTAMEIIHRDLKPENILVTMKQSGPVFKISDYGAGTIVAGGKQAVTNAGSPFYQAPEILLQDPNGPRAAYTNKCDIYSLGVIIYIFSYGTQHVKLQSMAQLRDFLNILKTKPFQCPEDPNVPQEVKELIEKMIVFDENKRISWADLQKFKLFEGNRQETQKIMTMQKNQCVQQNSIQIQAQNNIQIPPVIQINTQSQQNQQIVTINKISQQQQQFSDQVQTLQYNPQIQQFKQIKINNQPQTQATNNKQISIGAPQIKQNEISMNQNESGQLTDAQKPSSVIKIIPNSTGLNNQQQSTQQPNIQTLQGLKKIIIQPQSQTTNGNNIKIINSKQNS